MLAPVLVLTKEIVVGPGPQIFTVLAENEATTSGQFAFALRTGKHNKSNNKNCTQLKKDPFLNAIENTWQVVQYQDAPNLVEVPCTKQFRQFSSQDRAIVQNNHFHYHTNPQPSPFSR